MGFFNDSTGPGYNKLQTLGRQKKYWQSEIVSGTLSREVISNDKWYGDRH